VQLLHRSIQLVPKPSLKADDLVPPKEWVWTGDDLGAGWEQREILAELKDLADDGVPTLESRCVEMDEKPCEIT